MTMIDNSHCSPLYQNPADFGVDLIIHSATKYLNGHSDVVAGVICGSKNNIEKIFHGSYLTLGLIISPHDASLIIRGLRTLPIRMERSNETAFRMANELEKHPKIKQVIHPMLPSFPQYDLARKQMKGAGGLMTIQLNADSKEDVERFIGKLKKFLIAVSWGGYESLIMPSIVFHDIPGMADSPIHWTFIRFYIGLEDYDFLMSDIFQALETL
jgi:cystathionine beta-lyase/cystathionine gamma-synthase